MRTLLDTWITIVGMGDDGMTGLTPEAWAAVEQAAVLVGGKRHLDYLHEDERPRLPWSSPLEDSLAQLDDYQTDKICILASGDPNWYGIAKHAIAKFGNENVTIIPSVSSFSLAASRLGWGLQDVITTSVHGRPLMALSKHFSPGNQILTLTKDGETPAQIAAMLAQSGFAKSEIAVFCNLGGDNEAFLLTTVDQFPQDRLPDLNIVAIEVQPEPGVISLPLTPGLLDQAFQSDGQLTKREVRAMTLAALEPFRGHTLWDIGAGNGSVAVEWLRAAEKTQAFAFEKDEARIENMKTNAQKLGAPDLQIIQGSFPQSLLSSDAIPDPDAVFIGGGITQLIDFSMIWDRLKPGGRMVANVVTAEGESIVQALQTEFGGDMIRIAISRLEPVGDLSGWKPLMPVTQWQARKV